MATMKIIGMDGVSTPFDGQYVVEYDPDQNGVAPDGAPMTVLLRTTPNESEALHGSIEELEDLWLRVPECAPVREDGAPNRPLTAFNVEIQ